MFTSRYAAPVIYSGMCNSVKNVNPFHQVAGKLTVLVFLKSCEGIIFRVFAILVGGFNVSKNVFHIMEYFF